MSILIKQISAMRSITTKNNPIRLKILPELCQVFLFFLLPLTVLGSPFSILLLSPSERMHDENGLTTSNPDSVLELDGFIAVGRVSAPVGLLYAPPAGHSQYVIDAIPQNGLLLPYGFYKFSAITDIPSHQNEITLTSNVGTELESTRKRARTQGAVALASRLATLAIYGHSDQMESIPMIPNLSRGLGADFIYDANSGSRFVGGMGYGRVVHHDTADVVEDLHWNRVTYDGRPDGGAIEEYSLHAGTWQTTRQTSLNSFTTRTIDEFGDRIEFMFRMRTGQDWSLTPVFGWMTTHLTDDLPVSSYVTSRNEYSSSSLQANLRFRYMPTHSANQALFRTEGQAGFVDYAESPSSSTTVSNNTNSSTGAGYSGLMQWRGVESNLRPSVMLEYAHILALRSYGDDVFSTTYDSLHAGSLLQPLEVGRFSGALEGKQLFGNEWRVTSWVEINRHHWTANDTILAPAIGLYSGFPYRTQMRLSTQTQFDWLSNAQNPVSLRLRAGGDRRMLNANSLSWRMNGQLYSERWGGEVALTCRLIGSSVTSGGISGDRLVAFVNGGTLALKTIGTNFNTKRMMPWQFAVQTNFSNFSGIGTPQSVALGVGSVSNWLSDYVDSRTTITLTANFALDRAFVSANTNEKPNF